jgi:hypothetical protein
VTLEIMQNTNGSPSDLPGMTGPGVAPVSIAEVDKLVDKYVVARDARLTQLKLEVEAKEKLIASLHAHADEIGKDSDGTIVYRHAELIATLSPGKEDLKVKTIKGEENE